jgi:hypothetical protein
MYFKTKKTSETGQKLAKIEARGLDTYNYQCELAKKYGFVSWNCLQHHAWGVIYQVEFPKGHEVDLKIWRLAYQSRNLYVPKMNTKDGKALNEEIINQPIVEARELNDCVGFSNDSAFGKRIGLTSNEHLFGFSLGNNWEYTPPSDCVEITVSEYNMIKGL